MFPSLFFFFFNDTATTEIYTLSLHDALPILNGNVPACVRRVMHDLDLTLRDDAVAVLIRTEEDVEPERDLAGHGADSARSILEVRVGGIDATAAGELPGSASPPGPEVRPMRGKRGRWRVLTRGSQQRHREQAGHDRDLVVLVHHVRSPSSV